MGEYRPLFDIRVEHSFFSGACSCLNFVPTDKTIRLFDNAGLLIRKSSGGIVVVYDRSRIEVMQGYFAHDAVGLEFEFKAYAMDPDFKTYTKPFPDAVGRLLYFDNQTTAISSGKVVRLHESAYVSNKDFISMDSVFLIDILNQKERLIPPEFVIVIHANRKSNAFFDQQFSAKTPSFRLNFAARETYWKYYLYSDKVDESAYIADLDNRIVFEPTGPVKLSDGRTVMTFRSKQRIPLNEKYDFKFQLKQRKNGSEKTLYSQLPLARVSQTGNEVVADQVSLISEIYINC